MSFDSVAVVKAAETVVDSGFTKSVCGECMRSVVMDSAGHGGSVERRKK